MKKWILLAIFMPTLLFGQTHPYVGYTVEQLSAITSGVTNIASKSYWETYAYAQIRALINEQYNISTFTSTDATPAISGGTHFLTANASATTITDFDSHPSGASYRKIIYIHVNDDNTTIDHNSNLDCGGIDLAPKTGDILMVYWNATKWQCKFVYIE